MAQLLDGRLYAEEALAEVTEKVQALKKAGQFFDVL